MRPCLGCGEPSETTWCPTCRPPRTNTKPSSTRRGYDTAWRKLSERARRLQRFCSDCGTTEDLTTDHSPEAWQRKNDGKPIRLQDVAVVCRGCNSRRGAAKPTVSQPDPRGTAPRPGDTDPHGEAKFASVIPHTEIMSSGGGQ